MRKNLLIAYAAALVSSSAVFHFAFALPVLLSAVYAAASVHICMCLLAITIVAWRRSARWRYTWHLRRASALSERQDRLSGFVQMGGLVWLLLAVAELTHVLRAESIGGAL